MKENTYIEVLKNVESLIEGETDIIAAMATISCELYHAFEHFNWVGFYRLVDEKTLKVGPYQGTHGCLTIDIERGICGKCAREGMPQIENDVNTIPHHIACSNESKSEIVVPVKDDESRVRAVLDIDSTETGSFDRIDQKYLSSICDLISGFFRIAQ